MSPRNPQSAQEKALLERAQRYLPGGSTGNFTTEFEDGFIVQKAQGSKIFDHSGNEYLDYLLGSGPMILGHAHPAVVSAVREHLERGSTYFLTSEPAIELAEEICKAVPAADMVRFTTSGTDATFQCMRIARAYRRRDKVLKFEGGYHGSHDYAAQSVVPAKFPDYPEAVVGSAGIPSVIQETMLVAPYNDLEKTSEIIAKHHDELACVIVEPVQRIVPPVPGFLEGLREITTQYEIPLIFDEVVTGFRMAYGGAQEYFGVTPDLAAFGKIVGGGFPLAAICGRSDLMHVYDATAVDEQGFIPQVGTLSGNPIAATAGLATLAELRKPGAYEQLRDVGQRLKTALQETMDQAEIPARVMGMDAVFDVYFTDDEITDYRSTLNADGSMMRRFNHLLLERGILKGGQKIYVSLAHDNDDVEFTINAFKEVAEQLQAS